MHDDLISSETHQRVARIQREAAYYRSMVDELPLHFGAHGAVGAARRIVAAGLNRLAEAIAPN
jgi:hypothetical protein